MEKKPKEQDLHSKDETMENQEFESKKKIVHPHAIDFRLADMETMIL